MTPFLQFRLWWRRGSSGDRVAATLAATLVLALVAWALVPTTGGEDGPSELQAAGAPGPASVSGDVPSAPGAAAPDPASAAGTAAAGPQAGAQGATGAPAQGGPAPSALAGGAQQSTAAGRSCPPAPQGAAGVNDKSLLAAFALLDLAGPIGNGAANQASADDMQRLFEALIADLNGRGGVACRTVTAKFFKLNPISTDQGRSGCLQIIQSRPAIVVDTGGFSFPQSAYNCVPQQKIPILTNSLILPSEASKFAPYLASPSADAGTIMRNTAFGLKERGFFDPAKGFKKLGLLYDECAPEVNKLLDDALARAGITGAQVSKYSFACPSNGFASPAEMSQAASQHRLDGVTHVIPLTGGGSFRPYTEAAEGQGFRPKYAVTDYQGLVVTSASSLRPNPDNFDGAVAMTFGRYGIDTTPGFPMDPQTKRCQDFIVKAGLPAQMVFRGGGGACSAMWTFEAAFKHARSLAADGILPGLFNAGTLQLAYPLADASFRPPHKYYGGETWAPIGWRKDCICWHITDPSRRPSFAP